MNSPDSVIQLISKVRIAKSGIIIIWGKITWGSKPLLFLFFFAGVGASGGTDANDAADDAADDDDDDDDDDWAVVTPFWSELLT